MSSPSVRQSSTRQFVATGTSSSYRSTSVGSASTSITSAIRAEAFRPAPHRAFTPQAAACVGLLVPPQQRRVWGVFGDGEMDEPESLAALSLASREKLDNLVFVINCNLQRLDGPVRGNGHIVDELETLFGGAGWNVIKLLWGSDWDPLFARDAQGELVDALNRTVDGQLQTFAANDGPFNREHFFGQSPGLAAIGSMLTDDEIDRLKRGGHDLRKIHAAYHAAANHRGRPTVILAQTKKGFGMGSAGQGKMTTHQQKKLELDDLLQFRDRFKLPLTDKQVENLEFYKPAADSEEMKHLNACRAALGGSLPVNLSGGLVSKGHPIGATGLSMIHEVCLQLRGEAGERQARNARLGLIENGGGVMGFDEAACAVHILEKSEEMLS